MAFNESSYSQECAVTLAFAQIATKYTSAQRNHKVAAMLKASAQRYVKKCLMANVEGLSHETAVAIVEHAIVTHYQPGYAEQRAAAAQKHAYGNPVIAEHSDALARQIERIKADPQRSDIARDGHAAAEAGMPASECAYTTGSHLHTLWMIGYDSASANAPTAEHKNSRFNIMQSLNATPTTKRGFVVIDGQRLPSGAPAAGYKIVSAEMTRDEAIIVADQMEAALVKPAAPAVKPLTAVERMVHFAMQAAREALYTVDCVDGQYQVSHDGKLIDGYATNDEAWKHVFEDMAMRATEQPHVVAIGDAFNGITLYGPFATQEDADEYADTVRDNDYHIIEVSKPQ